MNEKLIEYLIKDCTEEDKVFILGWVEGMEKYPLQFTPLLSMKELQENNNAE